MGTSLCKQKDWVRIFDYVFYLFLLKPLRFKHMITGEVRSVKPSESRGGILSDEMGMGKSLALIALIVHTLDLARSCERHLEGDSRGEELRGTSGGPTIIIAPKSSINLVKCLFYSVPIANHRTSPLRLGTRDQKV